MELNRNTKRTPKEVFDRYTTGGEDPGFKRTLVAVRLAGEGESLISRSHARRVLARLEKFSEAVLDFQHVADISPAFADEIFRVFAKSNPDVRIEVMNANDDVKRMINKAHAAASAE